MIKMSADTDAKGWFFGPWNSDIDIPVGYANEGIDLLHYHEQMHEIYLIAQGTSTMLVDGKAIKLKQGDVIALEPGEVHTFTESSADYFHFVIHTPFVKGDKKIVEATS